MKPENKAFSYYFSRKFADFTGLFMGFLQCFHYPSYTRKQLAVMKRGKFLYSGNMKELLEQSKGHVWICTAKDEATARTLEKEYRVSSKQYVGNELQIKLISGATPNIEYRSCEATLENAYLYIANKELL